MKQEKYITDLLIRLNAPTEIHDENRRFYRFINKMENVHLVWDSLEEDVKKINSAMMEAIAEVAPKDGWIKIKLLADIFCAKIKPQIPNSGGVVKSRLASAVLESLGLINRKSTSHNYTAVYVDHATLSERPSGALHWYNDVHDWIKAHEKG
jgi:hypothetical protein